MKSKLSNAVVSAALVATMIATPVLAAPSSNDLKNQKEQVEGQVSSLESQLTELMDQISTLKSEIETKNTEIVKAGEEYDSAKAKEDEQYEAMKLRIKYMYEEGGSSEIMEKIVQSNNITDMLNQVEYVNSVHTYDRQMLEEYVKQKEEVEKKQEKLESEMEQLETMQTECESKEATLSSTIEDKKDEISTLDSKIQEAVAAEQAAAEAERARQEAANRAAAERAAANSGGSGSSSGGGGSATGVVNKSSVVAAAASYIGVPYKWGGTSFSGIDCSGLTQAAYAAVGISIPRTSGEQRNQGKTVGTSISSAQPGDILCYSGHVAIYAGGGMMIHAPHTGAFVCKVSARTRGLLKVVRF